MKASVLSAPLLGLVLAGLTVAPASAHPTAEPLPLFVVDTAALSAMGHAMPCGEQSAASRGGEGNAVGTGVVQMCVDVLRSTPGPSGSPSAAPTASPSPAPSAVVGGAKNDDTAHTPPHLALTGASPWVLAVSLGLTTVVVGVVVRRSRGAPRT